jgi:hypothetical protein
VCYIKEVKAQRLKQAENLMTPQVVAKFTQSLFSELPTDFDFDGYIDDLADRLHDWFIGREPDGEYFGFLSIEAAEAIHQDFDYIALATFLLT